MRLTRIILALLVAAPPVCADDRNASRFQVLGDTLVYDTDVAENEDEAEIIKGDIDEIRQLLRDNDQITTLDLNSEGGDIYAADQIGRIVMDFELDTVVSGICSSACVTVFLAGETRRMRLGSSIGFHQTSWSPQAIERYYDANREQQGWSTPFEFGSWIYRDTQAEVHSTLRYLVDRGVDPGFAIDVIGIDNSDVWYPTRFQLLRGGVLREAGAGN